MDIRKYIFAIFIIALSLIECKNSQKEDVTKNENYTLTNSYITLYTNLYGENGLIEYCKEETVSKNRYGQATDYSETRYYYDNKNNLIRKETYNTYNGQKELSSIDSYSPSMNKTLDIRYYEEPKDTMSYSYEKKNELGQVIEKYSKVNMLDLQSEDLSRMQYDDSGRLIVSISKNMINNEVITRTYQYQNVGDTLLVSFFENGVLMGLRKEYKSGKTDVEIFTDYEMQAIDSSFITKEKTTSIGYDSNKNKSIYIRECDSSGNPVKLEFQHWEK